jgi:Glycoside hydrolase 123, catalytic domain
VSKLLSRKNLRRAFFLMLALGLLGAAAAAVLGPRRLYRALKKRARAVQTRLTTTERCLDGPRGIEVCPASEMAKLPNHGPVPIEDWLFSPDDRTINLDAARNATAAFQIVLKAKGLDQTQVRLEVSDLRGPGGARIEARRDIHRFLAYYVWVEPGGYTWGGSSSSAVLPWPDFYPDALIPFKRRCSITVGGGAATKPVEVIRSFTVPPKSGANQSIWIDIYVPPSAPAGRYAGVVTLRAGGEVLKLKLRLKVHGATLPQRTSFHALGELYAPYDAEGIGANVSSPKWQRMSQCYQQLAHRHRIVFVERHGDTRTLDDLERGPTAEAWQHFDAAFGPALSGELFTERYGYRGTGHETPVSLWRLPYPQLFNGRLGAPLSDEQVAGYEQIARAFTAHLAQKGWSGRYLYAYVFDEIEGPTDDEAGRGPAEENKAYVAMVHEQMRRVQTALDRGAGGKKIHLIWTSHVDPSRWAGKRGLDLAGTIRLWSPNAGAAGLAFLRRRAAAGEQVWFYHAAHPAIGIHAINAPGTELRTWGVTTARYGFTGHFIWAVNFGHHEEPYRQPTYKKGDDRFGNGTMVYPGAGLTTIGMPARDEPIPSIRIKSWRRGLQDAELARLARARGPKAKAQVERLLRELIPRALSEASGEASWPQDSAVWGRVHRELLKLASPR